MTITARQIREARILLKWDQSTLAHRTASPPSLVDRAEARDSEPYITVAQAIAIKHALNMAGVGFTTDLSNARLRAPSPAYPDET